MNKLETKLQMVLTRKEIKKINEWSKQFIMNVHYKLPKDTLTISIDNWHPELVDICRFAWSEAYDYDNHCYKNADDKELINKLDNYERLLRKNLITLHNCYGKTFTFLHGLFSDCKTFAITQTLDAYMPTLTQAQDIFGILTRIIIDNPTIPYQYLIVRRDVYNFVKRRYNATLEYKH